MIIQVDADGAVQLLEAADFRRFSIAMPESETARTALAAIARLDGPDHAWIAPDQVRALTGPVSPDWEKGFAGMVAYATSKGWTDTAGAIRAHIERL